MQKLSDIRQSFLSFFERNGHNIVSSAPLVPQDDPTLLFVNAGMVPFKNRFTGIEKGTYNRATSSQKCVRAGGKHNDLDNVGYTARHHTFFEMLGNFSFGDYFKEDAVALAWELITKEFGLPKNRLLATVYHDDEEAVKIWKKVAGFSDDQIIRISTTDNFWSMGDTGPCGPCSEIFFDHGDKIKGGPPGSADEDGDRFIEIWNLVFMQYDRMADGNMQDLPAPSIDTGMGLERMAALLQGKHDNYDTDMMRVLMGASADISHKGIDGKDHFSHRIIADHLRSSCFLMADGVLPSAEGRGYVLRRIMRRAMRHAHHISPDDIFMNKLVPALIEQMGDAYPELKRASSLMQETLKLEETSFRKTLSRGLDLLEEEIRNLSKGDFLNGDVAFKLYDTYGFPLDLTEDILRAKQIKVDQPSFDVAMDKQKNASRAAWNGGGLSQDQSVWFDLKNNNIQSEFTGYDGDNNKAEILSIIHEGKSITSLGAGMIADILLDKTPFYAEGGGQAGDCGVIKNISSGAVFNVTDTQKKADIYHIMSGSLPAGALSVGDKVHANIDIKRRHKTQVHHSATHILHEVLRRVLGDYVSQKGSQVTDQGLRFDFSCPKPLSSMQIAKVESEVNQIIRGNKVVTTENLTPKQAEEKGALALFGEKYGDNVRVLFMGDDHQKDYYSVELCGGTHVNSLGDIGLFTIISETGVSSGIRRIEALAGEPAFEYLSKKRDLTARLSGILKTQDKNLEAKIIIALDEKKKLERQVSDLKKQLALSSTSENSGSPSDNTQMIGDVAFIGKILNDISPRELAPLMDAQKQKMGSGIILFLAINDQKVAVCVGVTKDLVSRFNAKDLVQIAVAAVGGKGGGGRPDFAQSGGSNPSGCKTAISLLQEHIASA